MGMWEEFYLHVIAVKDYDSTKGEKEKSKPYLLLEKKKNLRKITFNPLCIYSGAYKNALLTS